MIVNLGCTKNLNRKILIVVTVASILSLVMVIFGVTMVYRFVAAMDLGKHDAPTKADQALNDASNSAQAARVARQAADASRAAATAAVEAADAAEKSAQAAAENAKSQQDKATPLSAPQ